MSDKQRYGRTGASSWGVVDNLTLTRTGNQLTSVSDSGRGISSVTWNEIDLPQTVTFSNGSTINYYYSADGTKLREVRTVSGTVLETDDYYPLGGPLPTGTSTTLQPEKYQGKVWNPATAFNVYDFGARLYDPALGRWLSQDPLTEKYYLHSPYLFCAGNPMNFVDQEGASSNPIFDENGSFLGVDDAGFEGAPLFMLSRDYHDGMTHLEAIKHNNLWIPDHYSSYAATQFLINYHLLQSRPDKDGFVTIAEGVKWARSHPDAKKNPSTENTLYIDASNLNLGHFKDDYDEKGNLCTNLFNIPNLVMSLFNKNIRSTTYALGYFNFEYLEKGTTLNIISNDATDYDWNRGGDYLSKTIYRN